MSSPPRVHVLGVRHHGPGSARAVVAALEEIQPEAVLVEGPADADPLLAHVTDPGLVPPVALLAYVPDAPRVSAFWPFAVFSPEWQAFTWAEAHRVPVRFIDLPTGVVLAERETDDPRAAGPVDNDDDAEDVAYPPDAADESDEERSEAAAQRLRTDPIAVLAHTAGYEDPEAWWEDVVELRTPATVAPQERLAAALAPFEALTEAMTAIRAGQEADDAREQRREAHMRKILRETLKQTTGPVAVVCGAWHAPALTAPLPTATADNAVLRGLRKRRTTVTWVPWTHSRLSFRSGYGAGIDSPGWYSHLFTVPERTVPDWLTKVAALLRQRDLPVSSAHVIEATRLATTLAGFRGRPAAGLTEVQDATLSVLCDGARSVLAAITADLVVGEALGRIPDGLPALPLEADLAAAARRLRLKREPHPTTRELDLRKPFDLERSALLHRLTALGIGWAHTSYGTRNLGTFRETWELRWHPELVLDVIDAAVWGTTVEVAAEARLRHQAADADLAQLTAMVQRALLADLGGALPALLIALDRAAAQDHDITMLIRAVPALVHSHRYGDVRRTDTGRLGDVLQTLLLRTCAALPAEAAGIDDEAAEAFRDLLLPLDEAVGVHNDTELRGAWHQALHRLVLRPDAPPLLAGLCTRLLLAAGRYDADEAGRQLGLALSHGPDPAHKALWVEGMLSGSGTLLMHDETLLGLLDSWVCGLRPEEFADVTPLLRRTFATFETGERRGISQALTRTGTPTTAQDTGLNRKAMAMAAGILGLRLLPARQGAPDA